jgi:hypothetical protein
LSQWQTVRPALSWSPINSLTRFRVGPAWVWRP